MMRFVVLALAVLLAGCQAQFLWDEPPPQLQHVKSELQFYADQLKQGAYKALTHLDDTEFKDYKRGRLRSQVKSRPHRMDDTKEMHSPDSGVDSPGFSDTATTELISRTDSEHTSSADEWFQQGPNLPPLFPPHPPPPPPPPLPILPPQEDPEDVMGVLDVAS